MLTDTMIQQTASSIRVYNRGCQYYRDGMVKKIQYHADARCIEATVRGGHMYNVAIYFNRDLHVEDYDCECPAYYEFEGACKHVVALMKVVQDRWGTYFGQHDVPGLPANLPLQKRNELQSSTNTLSLLDYFQPNLLGFTDENEQAITHLVPIYSFSIMTGSKRHSLEIQIGQDRLYVMKDMMAFLDAYESGRDLVYGKKYVFRPRQALFDDRSKALLDLLLTTYRDEKQLLKWNSYSYYSSVAFSDKKSLKLSNSNLLKFLELMEDNSFDAFINQQKLYDIKITPGRPPFHLAVEGVKGGLKLALDTDGDVYYGLDIDFHYVYHKGLIYKVDDIFARSVKPLMETFSKVGRSEIFIADGDVSKFFSTLLPVLKKVADLSVDPSLMEKYDTIDPEKRIYFDRFIDGISARIEFQYEQVLINPVMKESSPSIQTQDGKIILRASNEESEILRVFNAHGFEPLNGLLVLAEEDPLYQFLKNGLPGLNDLAEIYYADEFKNMRINHSVKISSGVKLDNDKGLLALSFDYQDINPAEFIELLKDYRLKKKYHRMKSGSFIPLDDPEINTIAQLIEQLEISNADLAKPEIELPRYRAMYLDKLARESGMQLERNRQFKTLVREIREPEETEYEIPSGITASLRNYQKTGFKWLKSLAYYGFGGILADDMGLGKTLQVLTFILSEKTEDNLPSLVIAPTSLVYYWQDEAAKFAPSLNVKLVSGNQAERLEIMEQLDGADLIVTSYALIKRDVERYQDKVFKYCILDEAQNIKNPNTIGAKAVKQIKARGYFALTGTPVENSLAELWSIFDFLMPGYLLNHNRFKSRFETPIIKNSDQTAMEDLRRHISPFIMRRMKKEVLRELPEKIEDKMSCQMTEVQRKLYLAYLLQAQKEFHTEIQARGFEKSQIKILSILTRLRQICCHPSLFIENYTGGSGKLDLLLEVLRDAIKGGHRILVFSQFTSMLHLIQKELDKAKITYHYLDGSTPSEERMKMVHSFNDGTKEVFLISLKAGGTGLNLTGADVVIHCDPWWNPAVEDQATDRAYRIGQKNVVQVIKLISKDSIEEKIYALQEKKKALIDAVIKPGESFINKMSEEEIRGLFDL